MKFISLLLFFGTISLNSYGNEMIFNVVDQHNQKVANAIVKIPQQRQQPLPISNIAVMDQINKQFAPHVLLISAGQRVSFPNRDDIRHHVYSFSKAKPFEIKLYKNTPTEPIAFENSGVVELGCNIHDQMLGYIYITDSEFTAKTNEQGIAVIHLDGDNIDSNNVHSVSVWHPQLSKSRITHQDVVLGKQTTSGEYFITLNLHTKTQAKSKKSFKKMFGQK